MNRTITAVAAAFAILVSAHPVTAQQAEKVYRIGYLTPTRVIFPAFRLGITFPPSILLRADKVIE